MTTPKPIPRPTDHAGWAEHWGEQAVRAIRQAVANPHYTTHHDIDLENAVRYARSAFFRAARAKKYRYWEASYVLSTRGEL